MSFRVRTERRGTALPAGDLGGAESGDPAVYILEADAYLACVWPARGFNLFRWTQKATNFELIYADPQFLEGSSPTRSGIPILFPFPNRIRDGRYCWEGKSYQLPLNDSTKKNAIHGFACRKSWHVLDAGANAESAWVAAEFSGSRDAPDAFDLWPTDYRLQICYRLETERLRIEATVFNPTDRLLPFGLGYHPYFSADDACSIQVPARSSWELVDCLPTGKRHPLNARCDLNELRPFSELTLDDVLSDLPAAQSRSELAFRGAIRRRQGPSVNVHASPSFRETVVFTPPHRHAFCLEPYTCTTDAFNLESRGLDAGWLVLNPGQEWIGVVEMRVH